METAESATLLFVAAFSIHTHIAISDIAQQGEDQFKRQWFLNEDFAA